MGAQSSAGRGLVNLRPRERIDQSYPAGRDAHEIHPCRVELIVSVKINPSLVMMRECRLHQDLIDFERHRPTKDNDLSTTSTDSSVRECQEIDPCTDAPNIDRGKFLLNF